MTHLPFRFLLACAAWLLAALPLHAEDTAAPAAPTGPEAEMRAAVQAANAASQAGPSQVKLRDKATLALPAHHVFVPEAESRRLLQAMGNSPGPDLLGTVFSEDGGAGWLVVLTFVDSGHIADDEAKDWDAQALLKNLQEGTEAMNEERRKRGIPEMEVLGWVEPPRYDAGTHRLVWSASTKDKADPERTPKGVNYNTYLLGREGYVSLNLVTDYATVEHDKPVAHALLAALQFNEGLRYGDFNSSTDRMAEYGLAALVGGIAAKKLGLLALAGAFVLKFAKVIGVAAIAALGIGTKLFKGRKRGDPPA